MNPPADGYSACLGSHSDWGLTRESFAPLRDELADHLHCLAEDSAASAGNPNPEGGGTGVSPVNTVEQKLTSPKSRRALTATRIADQVYATLHRWPTKHEWREFGWLLCWYVLMLASDVLSARATAEATHFTMYYWTEELVRPNVTSQLILWSAWVLQGIARAGFFTAFGLSLYHAYRVGWGVLISRLLQLKLIHVVLVIAGGLSFSSLLATFVKQHSTMAMDYLWFQPYQYFSGPGWLTVPLISVVLVGVGLLLLLNYRTRALAAATMLLAFFLFPGGPLPSHKIQMSETFIGNGFYKLADGTLTPQWLPTRMPLVKGGYLERPAVRPDMIRGQKVIADLPNTLENRQLYYNQRSEGWHKVMRDQIDVKANKRIWTQEVLTIRPKFHVRVWKDPREYDQISRQWDAEREAQVTKGKSLTPVRLQGPVVAVGAGIGWLAAPIPVLTAVGLLLLIGVMGRRSPATFLLYTILAAAAMILTITPFFVGQSESLIFQLNPVGVVRSPFPGFEALMLVSWHELVSGEWMDATLILGLLLSAGVPWLLTALFLNPMQNQQRSSGPKLAA